MLWSKNTPLNIYSCFTNTELRANGTELTPKQSLASICIFSLTHTAAFSHSESQHLGTTLGGHFKNGNHPQKTQKWEKHGTKRPLKDSVYSMRAETRTQSVTLLDLRWERVHQVTWTFFSALHKLENDHERPASIALGVTKKILQVQEFTHTESADRIDCTSR